MYLNTRQSPQSIEDMIAAARSTPTLPPALFQSHLTSTDRHDALAMRFRVLKREIPSQLSQAVPSLIRADTDKKRTISSVDSFDSLSVDSLNSYRKRARRSETEAKPALCFDDDQSQNRAPKVFPSTVGITTYNSDDVLSGRGGGTNQHEGNCFFRSLINSNRARYLRAKKTDKPYISRSIVNTIRRRNGRFLKKDEDSSEWFEIGDDAAREKTSQALRQRAPEYRKLMSQNDNMVSNLNSSPLASPAISAISSIPQSPSNCGSIAGIGANDNLSPRTPSNDCVTFGTLNAYIEKKRAQIFNDSLRLQEQLRLNNAIKVLMQAHHRQEKFNQFY